MQEKQSHFNRSYFISAITTTIMLIILFIPNFSKAYEQQINTLSSAMAEKIAKADKKTIAVVDFTDLDGNVTHLGRFIAEELSGALAGTSKGFEVVNRNNLKLILKEHKLFESGAIDPKSAMRLGEIAGVQALVTGTITPLSESVRLSVSVLDINTAKVIDNKREKIPRTKDIDELLGKKIDPVISDSQGKQPKPRAMKESEKGEWLKKEKGFTFELVSCVKKGGNVKCNLFITSDVDTNIILYGHDDKGSRLCDNFGSVYRASSVSIANCSNTYRCDVDMIGGIRTIASLSLESVASNATSATIVELSIYDSAVGTLNVRFRNISFK